MKSLNREPEVVLIARKLGRPAPDFIKTDSFQLKRADDHLDWGGLVNTIQNVGTQATKVADAVSTTSASITKAYNQATSAVNAGYNNIVQNQNPGINAGYNQNIPTVNGSSLMPSLQLSTNPNTNMLIAVGLGILILAVVYSLFLRNR